MNGDATDVEASIERHREEWRASTSASAFIAGARDGTLDPGAFERWLAQDRHFVDGLYAAQLRIAALARGEARRTLLDGAVALQQELDWFGEQSVERGIRLDVEPVDDCLAFVEYLQTLAFAPLAVALTAIWAVERSYLDAWRAARPGAERYRESSSTGRTRASRPTSYDCGRPPTRRWAAHPTATAGRRGGPSAA